MQPTHPQSDPQTFADTIRDRVSESVRQRVSAVIEQRIASTIRDEVGDAVRHAIAERGMSPAYPPNGGWTSPGTGTWANGSWGGGYAPTYGGYGNGNWAGGYGTPYGNGYGSHWNNGSGSWGGGYAGSFPGAAFMAGMGPTTPTAYGTPRGAGAVAGPFGMMDPETISNVIRERFADGLEARITEGVHDRVRTAMREKLREAFRTAWTEVRLAAQVGFPTDPSYVARRTRFRLVTALKDTLDTAVRDQVRTALRERAAEAMRAIAPEWTNGTPHNGAGTMQPGWDFTTVADHVALELTEVLHQRLAHAVREQIAEGLRERLDEAVRTRLTEWLASSGGNIGSFDPAALVDTIHDRIADTFRDRIQMAVRASVRDTVRDYLPTTLWMAWVEQRAHAQGVPMEPTRIADLVRLSVLDGIHGWTAETLRERLDTVLRERLEAMFRNAVSGDGRLWEMTPGGGRRVMEIDTERIVTAVRERLEEEIRGRVTEIVRDRVNDAIRSEVRTATPATQA